MHVSFTATIVLFTSLTLTKGQYLGGSEPLPNGDLFTSKFSVSPTPTSVPNVGGHYACHDANFTGSCHYYKEERGECHEYAPEDQKKYTSIGPDQGQYCWFYEAEQCLGKKIELVYPGSKNLRGLRWDNRVRSWNCWKRE